MVKRVVVPYIAIVMALGLPVITEAERFEDYRNDYNNNNNRNPYQSNTSRNYNGYPAQAPQDYGSQGYVGGNNQNNPYGNSPPNTDYAPITRYDPGVVTVISRQLGSHVVLGGTVIPYREVTLTAQMPGRVQFIAGEEGDQFDINQVLVAVDDDDLLAKRRQSIAELSGVSSALRDSRVQYARELWSPQISSQQITPQPSGMNNGLFPQMFNRFFGGGGGGGGYNPYNSYGGGNPWATSSPLSIGNPWIERQADLYSRGTNVSQANSNIRVLQSKIDQVDAKLLDTRSIAPFEGVIMRKLVEIGDTVQPGHPMLHYADIEDLQIRLEVPARLMPGLHKGMILPANLDVGDLRVNARVAQIYPLADSKRHTVTVKLDLPKGVPGGPGMYAEVSIPDVSSAVSIVPVIPSSAIVWRGSLPAVFVVNHENKTELRLIRLGEHLDAQIVAVLSGIRAGERIYASPPSGLNSNWTSKPGAIRESGR